MQAHCQGSVEETLGRWHAMVASGDLQDVLSLLHADAVFRSPLAYHPYHSAEAVALVLTTVLGVFRDFAYEREFLSADGRNVVLEFRARVADRELKGVDLIRFDDSGRILDFEVMIRPESALKALGEEMGRRLAGALPRYRSPASDPS